MASHVNLVGVGLCVLAGALGAAGCGGGSKEDGGARQGGAGGSSSETSSGWPSRLPKTAAECTSATGSDGCIFKQCCEELVGCSDNAACAETFSCYTSCPPENADCLTRCTGSSFDAAIEDFVAALGCSAPASATCSSSAGNSGGNSSGGSAGHGGGGGGGGANLPPPGPLGSAQDDLGWNLVVSGEPLTAELALDDDRAVSQEITPEGGTLTATGEDGTVFELSFPEGALYGPTVITLTPLASFTLPALEGDARGVRIEPDGLPLMGAPTLAITPPPGVKWSLEQEVPLAITGADNAVSLALLDPESEQPRLVLTHFSSYAVLFSEKGIDSTLSQADIRNHFGGDVERRLESATAERLATLRLRGADNSEGGFQDLGFERLVAEYEELVVKPRVAKAGESCAAGKLAISTVLGTEREKQLLGWQSRETFSWLDLIPTVAEVCMREEYELCRDEHIITRVLPTLYGYMHQAAILGLETEIDGAKLPPTWLTNAENYARKCLQFEVQFDSDVTYAPPETKVALMTESVTARVPIGLKASLTVLPEDAIPPGAGPIGALIMGPNQPLRSKGYDVKTDEACFRIDSTNGEDGALYVSYMGFIPGANSPATPGGSAQITDIGLSIALDPNLSSYAYTSRQEDSSGCGKVAETGSDLLSWSTTLGAYLLHVSASENNGAWLTDWDVMNSDILATKDLSLDDGEDSRGSVHLVLFHTPE
jgi:hypothetical protein